MPLLILLRICSTTCLADLLFPWLAVGSAWSIGKIDRERATPGDRESPIGSFYFVIEFVLDGMERTSYYIGYLLAKNLRRTKLES